MTYSGTRRRYEGNYSAIADGRFRIDYIHPSRESAVFDGKNLVWIDREKKTAVIYKSPYSSKINIGTAAAYPRLFIGKGAVYEKSELISLFEIADVYRAPLSEGSGFERYWIGKTRGILLKRSIFTPDENELSTEIFSSFESVSGVLLPRRIDVFSGEIKSTARYRNIRVNNFIDETAFDVMIPPDYKIDRK